MLLTEILNEVPDLCGYNAACKGPDGRVVRGAGGGAVRRGALHGDGVLRQDAAWSCWCVQFVPLSKARPATTPLLRVLGCPGPASLPGPPSIGSWWRSGDQRPGPTPVARWRWMAQELAAGLRQRAGARTCRRWWCTAFDCETFMSLSQVVAQTGGGGPGQPSPRWSSLSLKGCIVSGDVPLHCHRGPTASWSARAAGSTYIPAIKEQPADAGQAGRRRPRQGPGQFPHPRSARPRTTAHGRHEVPPGHRRRRFHPGSRQEMRSSTSEGRRPHRELAHDRGQDHLTKSETMPSPGA